MKILSLVLLMTAILSIFLIGKIRNPASTLVMEGEDHDNKEILPFKSKAIHHNSYDEHDFRRNRLPDILQPQKENSLNSRITALKTEFEISQAIERLNNGSAKDDERLQIFDRFRELDHLRTSDLEIELAELERKVAQLQSDLPEKLNAFEVIP